MSYTLTLNIRGKNHEKLYPEDADVNASEGVMHSLEAFIVRNPDASQHLKHKKGGRKNEKG